MEVKFHFKFLFQATATAPLYPYSSAQSPSGYMTTGSFGSTSAYSPQFNPYGSSDGRSSSSMYPGRYSVLS